MNMETVIQHIVLPIEGFEGTEQLYARDYSGNFPILLYSGDSIDLRTYFNFFPSEKYRMYTRVKIIKLRLDCDGNPSVEIHRCGKGSDNYEIQDCSEEISIELGDECLIGLVIRASNDDVCIRGGYFFVDSEQSEKVSVAHIICTYHREKVIKEKLNLICDTLRKHPSILDEYRIYVVDNGCSLEYDDSIVKIIPSDNYGGSGGFSRGMIEAINDNVSTHVILNDDDAHLDPETVFRTISFYKFITEKNKETFLGGATFEKDKPVMIHESGAFYRNGKLVAVKGMDPTTIEGCVSADQGLIGDEINSYVAWCYVAMPCSVIRKYGMALPIFFQIDDVDYSLRAKDVKKITMCGISVWHPFPNSHSVNKSYFGIRNVLVVAASNGLLNPGAIKFAVLDTIFNTGCLRYRTAEAQLQAIKDFRKGPETVFEKISKGYSLFDEYDYSDSVTRENLTDRVINHGRLFSFLTLNGVLLPSIGNIEASIHTYETNLFYRKGRAYFRSLDGKVCVINRSVKKTISLIIRLSFNTAMLVLNMRRLNKRYRKASDTYCSETAWNRLFNHDN